MSELTDLELQVLALERQTWKRAGSKTTVIRDVFGWTPTRYHQVLLQLIDRPEALEHDPVNVNRLRRLRDQPRIGRRRSA